MAIRRVHVTREVLAHLGTGHSLLCGAHRVLTHMAGDALELGIKGIAVVVPDGGGLTLVGEADATGWSFGTARKYAEGWERTFGTK